MLAVRENIAPEQLTPSDSIYIVGLVDETKFRFQLMKVSSSGYDEMLIHKTYAPGSIKELHYVMQKFSREANFERYLEYTKPRVMLLEISLCGFG